MYRFLGHLPLVVLPAGRSSLALTSGVLRTVPHAEWVRYDSVYHDRQSHFEATAPVFFEAELDDSDESVTAFDAGDSPADQALRHLYGALLLTTGARLPPPEWSTRYLVVDEPSLPPEAREAGVLSGIRRRIGPCERELIVFGYAHHRVLLDEPDTVRATEAQDLLTRFGDVVAPALAALERTARPGYGVLDETLHLVAGAEALLVQRDEPLAATFRRRWSALVATESPEDAEALAGGLYALRSDLVHGRPVKKVFIERYSTYLEREHRNLTAAIVMLTLRWLGDHAGQPITAFHRALDG